MFKPPVKVRGSGIIFGPEKCLRNNGFYFFGGESNFESRVRTLDLVVYRYFSEIKDHVLNWSFGPLLNCKNGPDRKTLLVQFRSQHFSGPKIMPRVLWNSSETTIESVFEIIIIHTPIVRSITDAEILAVSIMK